MDRLVLGIAGICIDGGLDLIRITAVGFLVNIVVVVVAAASRLGDVYCPWCVFQRTAVVFRILTVVGLLPGLEGHSL